THPKVSNDSREMNPPSTTTYLQAIEELVDTAIPIQSLEASITAELQENQLKAADATEVPKKIVEKDEVAEEQTLEIPSLEQLLEEVDDHNQTMNDYEVSVDIQDNSESDVHSMHDDELRFVLEFKTTDSDDFHDNDVSTSDHIVQDDYASVGRLSLLGHMDHICEEVSSLHSRLKDLESSIAQKSLMKSIIIDETVEGEKKQKDTNAISAPTQGEHKTAKNITPPKPSPKAQGELAYKESALSVSKIKVNEESAMVFYESEKKDFRVFISGDPYCCSLAIVDNIANLDDRQGVGPFRYTFVKFFEYLCFLLFMLFLL
nr:hypothetical protein [Tanacetum cinerariifolium]